MNTIQTPNAATVHPAPEQTDTGERTLCLKDSVNTEAALVLVNQILSFNAADPRLPIHLQIFSPGGCVISGLAIIDVMMHVEAPIFTYAIGCAASMAAVILACGEPGHRYILPSTVVMIHQPSGQLGGTIENVRSTMGFHNRLEKRITELLSSTTGKSPAAVRKACRIDNWLNAPDALAFGLVDHQLTPFTPTNSQQKTNHE